MARQMAKYRRKWHGPPLLHPPLSSNMFAQLTHASILIRRSIIAVAVSFPKIIGRGARRRGGRDRADNATGWTGKGN